MMDVRLDQAAAFLTRTQDSDAMWRDFVTLAGESSDWVTAFVAHAAKAAPIMDDQLSGAVERAARALVRRQRPNGGWSYNLSVPTDADSTALGLLALSDHVSWRPSAVLRGVRYLRRHRDPETGGFSTYGDADGIHRYIDASPELVAGWTQPHICVTAVAVQALLLTGDPGGRADALTAVPYLLAGQSGDGLWRSYWWSGVGYPTYMTLRALGMARALSEEVADHCRAGLAETIRGWDETGIEPSDFDRAFVLLSCLLLGHIAPVEVGIQHLRTSQREDGSWPASPILQIPPPPVLDPASITQWRFDDLGTGVVLRDVGRIFGTAAVLWCTAQTAAQLRADSPFCRD